MRRHSILSLPLALLAASCTSVFGAAVTSPSPVSNLMDFQGGITVEGTRPASTIAGVVAIGNGTIAAGGDGYFNGYLYFNTNATTNASGCNFGIAGEAQSRLAIYNSGSLLWGSGSAAFDTSLARLGAGNLNTGGSFTVNGKLGIGNTAPVARLSIQDTAYPSTFSGLSSTIGIGNGIQNGQFAKLTFGNAGGNYGGVGMQVSSIGSYLHLGTSNNYANGITNSAVVIDPSGNVGLGSVPVAGQGQLQIQPGSGDVVVRLNGGMTSTGEGSAFVCGQGGGYNQAFGNWSGVIGGAFDNMGILFSATGWKITTGGSTPRMTITSAGNTGLGTTTPSNVLHLVSSSNAGGRFDISSANGSTGAANLILANANTTNGNASGIEFINGGGGPTAFISAINSNHNIYGSTTGGLEFSVYNAGTLSQHALVIAPSGNVGIGVPSPTSALAVNGIISAKEIKVVANPADYVFADGYRLRPLAEVEAFITAHKHLPGVPAAKEQEEHGEMVADLMRAHLEKIEELNLYAIQQQKVIEGLVAQQKAAAEAAMRQDAVLAQVVAKLAAIEAERGSRPAVSP